jgi:hypothetical protein
MASGSGKQRRRDWIILESTAKKNGNRGWENEEEWSEKARMSEEEAVMFNRPMFDVIS